MSLSTNESNGGVSNELSGNEWHVLANKRRRLAIALLVDRTDTMGLDDLAKEITEEETGMLDDGARVERVSVSLHHVHLPKLDAAGVLNYDPDTHRIEPLEGL